MREALTPTKRSSVTESKQLTISQGCQHSLTYIFKRPHTWGKWLYYEGNERVSQQSRNQINSNSASRVVMHTSQPMTLKMVFCCFQVALSSLTFAISHLDLQSLLPLTALGTCLGSAYCRHKPSVVRSLVAHIVYNVIAISLAAQSRQ